MYFVILMLLLLSKTLGPTKKKKKKHLVCLVLFNLSDSPFSLSSLTC